MTIERVLTNVMVKIGINNSSPQILSSDFSIRQIRSFLNEAGQEIARRSEFPRLTKTFSVAGGLSQIALPDDFYEMAESGAIKENSATFTAFRPVVEPELWSMLSTRPSSQNYYHLSEGNLYFSPTLGADGAIVRYISDNWIEGKSEATQNGDVVLIPERLLEKGTIWRWRRQKGLPYDDMLAEYEADLISDTKASRGAP